MIDIIIKYGLSIRQIPLVVTNKYYYLGKELTENQVLEVWKPDLAYFEATKGCGSPKNRMIDFYLKFPEGRTLIVETKVPKNAGYWMCKQVKHTSSTVRWNTKKDNLAPTLEESINLFLKNL